MNCPVCDSTRMREVEKNGIAIDICPSCKGVWLDRGELEKLMSGVKEVREDYNDWYYGEAPKSGNPAPYQAPHQGQYTNSRQYSNYPPYKKKKKSVMDVLGDLFD